MKCAIYARVSKDEQDVETQLRYLKSYAKLRGWEVSSSYIDEGLTGRSAKRPRYQNMLTDIKNGWVDYEIVLFKEISRLGRDRIELDHLRKLFDVYNIKMVSATQPIDTTTPFGRLIFNLLCDLAEFESDWISQRTRDALQERRKIGRGKRGPDKIQRKKRVG